MCYNSRHFYRKAEFLWTSFVPLDKSLGPWKPVKRHVQFNGVEVLTIKFKPFCGWKFIGVKKMFPCFVANP